MQRAPSKASGMKLRSIFAKERRVVGVVALSLAVCVAYSARIAIFVHARGLGEFLFVVREAPPLYYICDGMKVERIYTEDQKISHGQQEQTLPRDLLVSPGKYTHGEEVVELPKEGLLRIVYPGRKNIQRILFANDEMKLLASICWTLSHGNRDDKLSIPDLLQKATGDKLVLTCSRQVEFAQAILTQCNISSRRIDFSARRNRNGYNDGHVMMEVRQSNRTAVLVDVASNCVFLRQNETLDLAKFLGALSDRDVATLRIADDISIDPTAYKEFGFNFVMVMEYIKGRPVEWYSDVCGTYKIGKWTDVSISTGNKP